MAQFDSLIIFPILWSLLLVLILYYTFSIEILIPAFFGAKKFREKKLGSPRFYSFLNQNSEINTSNSYSTII